MRSFILSIVFILSLAAPVSAETIKATVNGLVCAFCATGIEKTFKKQPAVDTIKVDLESKLVTIGLKPDQKLDDASLTKLINDAGYTVVGIAREK
jgi:copper chaperone CopZ